MEIFGEPYSFEPEGGGYLSRVARSLSMQRLREKVQVLPLDDDILILDEGSIPYSLSLRLRSIKTKNS